MRTMIGIAALACCSVASAQGDWTITSSTSNPAAQAFSHIENTLGVKQEVQVDYGTTVGDTATAEATSVNGNGMAQAESRTTCEASLTYLNVFLYKASISSMWELAAAGHNVGWAGYAKCHGNGYTGRVLKSKKAGTARGLLSFSSDLYGALPTHLDEYVIRVGVGDSYGVAYWNDQGGGWEVTTSVVNIDESPDRIETSDTYGGWEGLEAVDLIETAQTVASGEEVLIWSSINYVFPEQVISFGELINAGTRIDSELWGWGIAYLDVFMED